MESIVEGRSQTLSELDLASQDLLWEGAKAAERLAASGPTAA
jgi:hypothetical protein